MATKSRRQFVYYVTKFSTYQLYLCQWQCFEIYSNSSPLWDVSQTFPQVTEARLFPFSGDLFHLGCHATPDKTTARHKQQNLDGVQTQTTKPCGLVLTSSLNKSISILSVCPLCRPQSALFFWLTPGTRLEPGKEKLKRRTFRSLCFNLNLKDCMWTRIVGLALCMRLSLRI